MADQKRWFKVWTSVVSDDDFDASRPGGLVSLGRFSMLGAFTALHGNGGRVGITLQSLLRITSATNLDELRADLAFKNVIFEEGKNRHGKVTVTWQKWKKYQEDSTQAERQKASRAKRRGEEKREEKTRQEHPPEPPKGPGVLDNGFQELWALHPVGAKKDALEAYRKIKPPPEAGLALKAQLEHKAACDQRGEFCARPQDLHRWLKKRRWEDEIPAAQPEPKSPYRTMAKCATCGEHHFVDEACAGERG